MTDVLIDLDALARNIQRMSDRIAPSRLMAVVKSDAYGHGALAVARTAERLGVGWLGVLDAETGILLREHDIDSRMRMFAWLFSPDEDYARLIDAQIDLGLSSVAQLDQVESCAAGGRAQLHLEIDTGLHRNGSTAKDWPEFVARALELESAGVADVVGVWTHIGEASVEDDSIAISRFHDAVEVAGALGVDIRVRHLAASAAGQARADARFDLVRSGAFLYGIAPGDGVGPHDVGIEPVMTLRGTVAEVRASGGGSTAHIDTGWLDGVPPHAGGRVQVAIRGTLHLISSVSAHSCECSILAVAHGESGAVAVGDVATFFGSGADGEQTLQHWADALDTIGEEIVLGVPRRLARTYSSRSDPTQNRESVG